MKLTRIAASTAAAALVAASAFALATPAVAAPPAGVTFVEAGDITLSATFANVGWGNESPGGLSSTLNGLSMDNNVALFYGFNSNVPTSGGSTLRNIGNSSYFYASNDADLFAEIQWYTDAGFTDGQYFFADQAGPEAFTDPAAIWYSTATIGAISAFSPTTLDALDAELFADASFSGASVHSVGLYNDGGTVFLSSFPAGGNLFFFTPVPVSTAAASIGQYSFGTGGYTATTTGFIPGETVSVYPNTTESTSDPIDIVADANGAVTYTWIAPVTTMDVGTYSVNFSTQFTSGLLQLFEFDVVAQAAPAALAASGTDSIATIAVAAAVLLAGAALAVVARRRRLA